MKKYVWIVERADSIGEFQPLHPFFFLGQDQAREFAEKIKAEYGSKVRVVKYIRLDIH